MPAVLAVPAVPAMLAVPAVYVVRAVHVAQRIVLATGKRRPLGDEIKLRQRLGGRVPPRVLGASPKS